MIINFLYRIPASNIDTDAAIERLNDRANKMSRLVPQMLGLTAERDGDDLLVGLRISGLDRWRIARKQRKLVVSLATHAGLSPDGIKMIQSIPEQGRVYLKAGEGRTERDRRRSPNIVESET